MQHIKTCSSSYSIEVTEGIWTNISIVAKKVHELIHFQITLELFWFQLLIYLRFYFLI